MGTQLHQVGDYVDAYMTLPAGAPGKQALQAFFFDRYAGDVSAFNAAWGQTLASFDELQTLSTLGSDFRCEPSGRTADRRGFVAHAAAHYYRTVHDALRAVASDMLILGSRFLSTFTSREVLAAAAPWIDVVSVNNYQFDAAARNLFRQTGGDLYQYLFLDGPFADLATVHAVTGKPVMITEYTFRTPTPGAPNLYPPFFPTLPTQAERADAYEGYQRELLARPYLIGAHWFQHYDQPATGRFDGENSLFGLVTVEDEPYPELTTRATAMNALIPERPVPSPAPILARGLLTPPLGRRTFSVASPEGDRTGYFIFIIPGTNLATAVSGDALQLDAGSLDDAGVAALSLAEDVVLGVHAVTGDIACLRLRAVGSSGTLSCSGGIAHDAVVTRATGETAPPPTATAFAGAVAPPGSATLLVPLEVAQLPAGATFDACLTTGAYEALGTLPLTTATSTIRKGAAQAVLTGEPFACGVDGAEWRREDGPGMLVVPLPIFDPRVPGGDLAGSVRLADRGLDCGG